MNNILSYRVLLYIYIYNISFSKKFNVLYLIMNILRNIKICGWVVKKQVVLFFISFKN